MTFPTIMWSAMILGSEHRKWGDTLRIWRKLILKKHHFKQVHKDSNKAKVS